MKVNYLFLITLLSLSYNVKAQTISVQKEDVKDNVILDLTVEKKDDVLLIQEENLSEKAEEEKNALEKAKKAQEDFLIALQVKKLDQIQEYINNGANINIDIYEKNKAVHISASHGDVNYFNFLNNNGANILAVNGNGENIWLIGAKNRNMDFLSNLKKVAKEKDFKQLLTQRDKYKRNALHNYVLYTYSLNEKFIDFLISNGVNVNEQDVNGRTPINYAIASRKWNIIEYLLKNKGSLEIKDENGVTVEQHLLERMDVIEIHKVVNYLSEKGKAVVRDRIKSMGPVSE